MEQDSATNPIAGEPVAGVAEAGAGAGQAEPTDDTLTPPAAEGQDPGQAGEDDGEEIEHDGRTYRVPKALKDAFLMQADYTRKTQELADGRRAVEADQARVRQLDTWAREHAVDLGALVAIDTQLAQFAKVDWDAWEQQDPLAAQRGYRQFQQLKDQRGTTVQRLEQRDAARAADAQRETARRMAEGRQQLAKAIPGWSEEKSRELGQYGIDHYGLTVEEVDNLVDPRLVRILNDAMLWRRYSDQQRAAASAATATPPAKPVTVVGARRGGPPVAASNPASDRLSGDEWLRRREAEIAARQPQRVRR